MSYSTQLIRKHEQTTTKWSGGDTTELAIYPADADYAKRNFHWRISSAVVEAEESVFTPLPAIDRIIMVIDGEMMLKHEGHHQVHLKPYEQDRFSGGWTTRSYGKVRDFNLMLADGYSGALEAITVGKDRPYEIGSEKCRNVEAFYSVQGRASIQMNEDKAVDLEEGDLLLIHREEVETSLSITLVSQSEIEAKIIRANVMFDTLPTN
ncbi:HutD family protein [Sporosarcina sp. GW1-11]|uniref:HutD/Ves family protein n=1 Tax=Sporosarcina sp. GW1-11 TaxID=2899126 RepID=UPI00294EB53D|nr:HutD family protein [Sporosarcina sp. GW1-11]MDV6379471.1 HutD family protein [Sporosarcina sp. GW1-11]